MWNSLHKFIHTVKSTASIRFCCLSIEMFLTNEYRLIPCHLFLSWPWHTQNLDPKITVTRSNSTKRKLTRFHWGPAKLSCSFRITEKGNSFAVKCLEAFTLKAFLAESALCMLGLLRLGLRNISAGRKPHSGQGLIVPHAACGWSFIVHSRKMFIFSTCGG